MDDGWDEARAAELMNVLVDDYRASCLWFLRPDYYPKTSEDRLRTLTHIERHGDVAAFRRAAALRRWLSRPSSARSAG